MKPLELFAVWGTDPDDGPYWEPDVLAASEVACVIFGTHYSLYGNDRSCVASYVKRDAGWVEVYGECSYDVPWSNQRTAQEIVAAIAAAGGLR